LASSHAKGWAFLSVVVNAQFQSDKNTPLTERPRLITTPGAFYISGVPSPRFARVHRPASRTVRLKPRTRLLALSLQGFNFAAGARVADGRAELTTV